MSARSRLWSAIESARAWDVALTRRNDGRSVLIDSRTAMNYVMAAPVQAAMAADPRVRFYATSTEAPSKMHEIYRRALPGTTLVSPLGASLMRFDAYLTADLLWARLPRGTRRIQMFHGVAGKFTHDYDTPDSSMRRWHRFFFVNRRRMQNFIKAGAIDPASDAPRLVGMPKVDCLVDGSLRRDDVLRRLRMDPARPTILYAPTWSAASSLNTMGVELLAGLLARPWNVIVKLHDRSRDARAFYSGGIDWAGRIAQLMIGKTGHLVADADICPYLAAADVMITDHSSAGFEYLLLDRPLVRIHVPELIKTSNINEEYVQLLMDASRSADDAAGALRAVERSLADPAAGSGMRRAVAEDLFYRAGTATRRAVDELYDAIELARVPVVSRVESDPAVAQ
ncbi:MAG TPA: CDP-glycerol glycerophosphotransferase family protein [Vicinamibacterales bacterium]|nr:CDP-glycerol glycerophosphotransferase family protein [Vicinamibacterales bacterium]